MSTVADTVDAVIGVDTHTETHTAVLVASSSAKLAEVIVTNTADGFEQLLAWVAQSAPGPRVLFAVEGTRSHGAGLARALTGAGHLVVEVERPRRADQRSRGKSDAIDALAAARAALGYDPAALPTPRGDGIREALRILLQARLEMTTEKTAKGNRLLALLLTGDDQDRQLRPRVRGMRPAALNEVINRPAVAGEDVAATTRRDQAARLARDITALTQDLKDNKKSLTVLVEQAAPGLLAARGIGPVSAAQAIVTWSHPGRCRSEAAFAMLTGAAPLPATSGQRQNRHRLNRGGDRAANRALHDIARTRARCCPRTRAYIQRRTAEGLTDREIRRCLKRYIARELHRYLTAHAATTP